mgnify:FL=1
MKAAILVEEVGLELRLTPETAYDRQALRVLQEAAKLKPGFAGMLTILIARDTSNESGDPVKSTSPRLTQKEIDDGTPSK